MNVDCYNSRTLSRTKIQQFASIASYLGLRDDTLRERMKLTSTMCYNSWGPCFCVHCQTQSDGGITWVVLNEPHNLGGSGWGHLPRDQATGKATQPGWVGRLSIRCHQERLSVPFQTRQFVHFSIFQGFLLADFNDKSRLLKSWSALKRNLLKLMFKLNVVQTECEQKKEISRAVRTGYKTISIYI